MLFSVIQRCGAVEDVHGEVKEEQAVEDGKKIARFTPSIQVAQEKTSESDFVNLNIMMLFQSGYFIDAVHNSFCYASLNFHWYSLWYFMGSYTPCAP